MGEYFYYEDDFEPKGPSLFRRFLSFCMFMINVHAFFLQLIALLVTCVYVSYLIFKALKTNDKEKQADLLIASVIFNLFYVVEYFTSWLLKFIPFYYELKLVVFIWLLHPKSRGATKIYKKFIEPQLDTVEKQIDENIDKVSTTVSPSLEKAVSTIQQKIEQSKKDASATAEGEADGGSLLTKVTGALEQADKYLEEPIVKKVQ